ncbi:tRNA lysidine(34) synthetase TilS [Sphingobium boeckii]|uniref:tRNA(Ile)-lysidine synthase n=1 Tax=Sphingobium boeckii TaxID=1082345 RepID=A0A7W9AEB0_9SPHN|nr:tRNA lysidine(34) synthetase TilS [Sphingobium boeckii]MBB5684030.1 tRNA(Ile)-lysidine synthase [Sphingobium boeckii]
MPVAISPDLIERFRSPLAWIDAATARIGVAVSGGPDSLALLMLAHGAWPGRVHAATVDHGLRPEAAHEAAFVAGLCAAQGIAHSTLSPTCPITGSVQQAARRARYALLEEWRTTHGLMCIMTAHHADDQAETLLMRLNRGAGVGGLAGIRAENGHVIRPLLAWRREDLAAIVSNCGLHHVNDPSNADSRFDRVRMRTALRTAEWIDIPALARSAAHLADAEAALSWAADRLESEHIIEEEQRLVFDPASLPEELVRRLLLRAIARLDPSAEPSGPELDRALAALRSGRKTSLGALVLSGGKRWRIAPAPPRRAAH